MKEVLRDISNGNLVVKNVPHLYNDGELFADGSEFILSGKTVYTLTHIFRWMLDNKIYVYHYDEFKLQ